MIENCKENDVQQIEYGDNQIRHEICGNGKIDVDVYGNHRSCENRHYEDDSRRQEVGRVFGFLCCRAITAGPHNRTSDESD